MHSILKMPGNLENEQPGFFFVKRDVSFIFIMGNMCPSAAQVSGNIRWSNIHCIRKGSPDYQFSAV